MKSSTLNKLKASLVVLSLVASAPVTAFSADITKADTSRTGNNSLSETSVNSGLVNSLGRSTSETSATSDSVTAALGVRNVLLNNEFNIFNVSPAQITEWGTAYAEIWNTGAASWGGTTVGLPVGRLGVFLGRPYAGVASNTARPIGATSDASANTVYTGVQTGLGGAWLDTSITAVPAAATGAALYDTRVLAPKNLIDIMYGFRLGDAASLGLSYAYASNSDEQTWNNGRPTATTPNTAGDGTITNERKTTDHQVGLGVLLKNLGVIEKLDLGFNVSMANVDNSHSETSLFANGTKDKTFNSTLESDGAMTYGFLLRSIFGLGGSNKLVTAFSFNKPNTSSKGTLKLDTVANDAALNNNANDIDRNFTLEDKATNIRFDAAWHQQPTEALKLIYSLGFLRQTSSREFSVYENNNFTGLVTGKREHEMRDESYTEIPLGIAVEHQTFSKLATRFGVQKRLYGKSNSEITDQTNRTVGTAYVLDQQSRRESKSNSNSDATVTLGLGFQPAKDVSFDFALESSVFDLDSGAGVSDVITRGSLKYHF